MVGGYSPLLDACSGRGHVFANCSWSSLYSPKAVAWEVHTADNGTLTAELIRKACLRENDTFLGVRAALWQRVPNDRRHAPCNTDPPENLHHNIMLLIQQRQCVHSESLLATLKHISTYPTTPFASLNQARPWVHQFTTWCNVEHHHHAIQHLTPLRPLRWQRHHHPLCP